ncbi:MAG: amidohydrolase [Ruminococcus sp.]|nr:amidohydrolase [Ruminococcus sp.]
MKAIKNAKIITMDKRRRVIENGYVKWNNKGFITKVAEGECDESDAFDAKGLTLYPGFIDAHTHLGLTTNGVGEESDDFNEESDPCTPHMHIIDGINPMDESFEEAVKAGITACAVSPGSANAVAGDIAFLHTVGRRIDKMLIRNVGMKFALGENPKMTYMNKEQTPYTRLAIAAVIREALFKAKRYMQDKQKASEQGDDEPEIDIKSEALIPLLKGQIKAHFHCHRADDIFTAIRIAKEFDLDYLLIHCTDGHLIADELREENACAVVGPLLNDKCKPELANFTPKNAGVLDKAGVSVSVCTDHSETPIQYLPLTAVIAVKNGLSRQAALEAITINPAKALGVDDIAGSIEKGKLADMSLFEGDPLDIYQSPEMVVVSGEQKFIKEH